MASLMQCNNRGGGKREEGSGSQKESLEQGFRGLSKKQAKRHFPPLLVPQSGPGEQ